MELKCNPPPQKTRCLTLLLKARRHLVLLLFEDIMAHGSNVVTFLNIGPIGLHQRYATAWERGGGLTPVSNCRCVPLPAALLCDLQDKIDDNDRDRLMDWLPILTGLSLLATSHTCSAVRTKGMPAPGQRP